MTSLEIWFKCMELATLLYSNSNYTPVHIITAARKYYKATTGEAYKC